MIRNAPEDSSHLFRLKKSAAIQLLIAALALAILVPQLRQFSNSWSYLVDADWRWLLLAFAAMSTSIIFAALVYMALVPKKLSLKKTSLIQLATYFTNRLLPSGLGGIGFNALYLVRSTKMSRTDAAVFATANNLIGFVAFSLCFGITVALSNSKLHLPDIPSRGTLIAIGVCALIVCLIVTFFKNIHKKVIDFLGHLVSVAMTIIRNPGRLLASVLYSVGITISYTVVLWASTKSVGISISLVDLFIAFIAGNAALTISPTPGGIGAVEASITAVLVSVGVSPSLALAAVILFRTISYWIPIIPGYIAFRTATKRQYV